MQTWQYCGRRTALLLAAIDHDTYSRRRIAFHLKKKAEATTKREWRGADRGGGRTKCLQWTNDNGCLMTYSFVLNCRGESCCTFWYFSFLWLFIMTPTLPKYGYHHYQQHFYCQLYPIPHHSHIHQALHSPHQIKHWQPFHPIFTNTSEVARVASLGSKMGVVDGGRVWQGAKESVSPGGN